MLQKYKEDHQVNYTVNTFGFGYNLNSKLLDELATEGKRGALVCHHFPYLFEQAEARMRSFPRPRLLERAS
jgi:hypothetical protein